MSNLKSISAASALKVSSATVVAPNPIIFKNVVIKNLSGLTKDGETYYQLDLKDNTATEVTAEGFTEQVKAGLLADKPTDFQRQAINMAENLQLITAVTYGTSWDANMVTTDIQDFVQKVGMKVSDVAIKVQNEIIFKTSVVGKIQGLVKDGDSFFELDLKNNSATLINPEEVAKLAKQDFLKGKATSYTKIAQAFNLIESISLVKKGAVESTETEGN